MIKKWTRSFIFVSIGMATVDSACHACPAKSALKEEAKSTRVYKVVPSSVPSLHITAYTGVSAPGRDNRGFGYYLEATDHSIALNQFIEAATVSQSKDRYILRLALSAKYKKAVQQFVSESPPNVVTFQLSFDGRLQARYGDPSAHDLETLHLVISKLQFDRMRKDKKKRVGQSNGRLEVAPSASSC